MKKKNIDQSTNPNDTFMVPGQPAKKMPAVQIWKLKHGHNQKVRCSQTLKEAPRITPVDTLAANWPRNPNIQRNKRETSHTPINHQHNLS